MTTSAKVGKWVSPMRWHLYFLLLLLVMDSESWALIRDAYKLERHVNDVLDVEQAIKLRSEGGS